MLAAGGALGLSGDPIALELANAGPRASAGRAIGGLVAAHIFRWDLDKTYLQTEFDSVRDLVRTARLTAEERQNVPGSAALLRAIRRDDPGHQIYFISGSPNQMRPVLEQKFELDGFSPDGFVLKPTLRHMIRGRFRAIRGQVAYKLTQLLVGRAEAKVGTMETLVGDDAESDAFVYTLYADLLSGRASRGAVRELLTRTGAYPFQVDEVEEAARWVVKEPVVKRLIIHLDQRTPAAAFEPYAPRCIPVFSHLQTALVFFMDESLGAHAVHAVAEELMQDYAHDGREIGNLVVDLVRRCRRDGPPDAVERIAAALAAYEGTERVQLALREAAERVRRLRSSSFENPRPSRPELTNYVQLWQDEKKRRADRKRARRAEPRAPSR